MYYLVVKNNYMTLKQYDNLLIKNYYDALKIAYSYLQKNYCKVFIYKKDIYNRAKKINVLTNKK